MDKEYTFDQYYTYLFLLIFISCAPDETLDIKTYNDWTITGGGLTENTTKNVLTEFVGSTNCPYCPQSDALLLSYFDSNSENFVGDNITNHWFLINYHTYSPSRGDPMYEFHRGDSAEEDFCYIRFEEGSWYTIYGVPTTFTNGISGSIYPEMAEGPMTQATPIELSLDGTVIDGYDITVQITLNSVRDMTNSDSLHLFIAATLDDVDYTGYNGEPIHQDVFLGWINGSLNGEILSLPNEQISKTYTWKFPENWPQNNYETSWAEVKYDISNIAVVAFVQNKYSKEILQVGGVN